MKHTTVLSIFLSALLCLSTSLRSSAQSPITFARSTTAMEFVGGMAHPMQDVLDVRCLDYGSDYVDISIKFGSLLRDYWENYRINLKSINGNQYYYSIVRTKQVSIYDPFNGLSLSRGLISGIANYMGYGSREDDDVLRVLYGNTLSNMSASQLAAYNLFCYYLDYVD